VRAVWVAALVVVACSSPRREEAAASPTLKVIVDGALVAQVPVAELRTRPRLAELVSAPVATWREIEAPQPGGPTLVAVRLDELYRDQDAVLYLDDGKPALGMFRRVAADAPQTIRELAATPTIAQAGISEVRIRTREVAPAKPPPLTLVAGDRRCALDDAALGAITPAGTGRGGADRRYWDVRALSRHCFGADPTRVKVGTIDVDAATLARSDRLLTAKISRRGQLKVRLVDPTSGSGQGRAGMLAESEGAPVIEVELAP
jgi:hypothetical protein